MLLLSAFSLISAVVNISTGGKAWSLIVVAGAWMFWLNIVKKPLIENSAANRLSQLLLSSCATLMVIDLIYGSGFMHLVLPILMFSMLIILGAIFFLNFRKQRRNLMPLYYMVGGAGLTVLGAFIGILRFNWATIVLAGISAFYLAISIIWFRAPLLTELKKRFHVG